MMRGLMRDREKLYDDSALRYRVDDINAFPRKEYTRSMKPRFNNEANDFNDGEKLNRCSFARYTRRCQKTRDRMCVSVQRKIERSSFDDEATMKKQRRMKNDVNEEEVR